MGNCNKIKCLCLDCPVEPKNPDLWCGCEGCDSRIKKFGGSGITTVCTTREGWEKGKRFCGTCGDEIGTDGVYDACGQCAKALARSFGDKTGRKVVVSDSFTGERW